MTVLVRSCKARSITVSEFFAPSSAMALIFSASPLIWDTFSLIVTVVAAVSCIPAASCWLVAELSEHIWFTVSVTSFNSDTFSLIFCPASWILATISRRFLRIICISAAIIPISSFLLYNRLLLALWVKSKLAVLVII